MIGTKKLSTIRKEIRDALAADGQDPIKRLDQMIKAAKRKGRRTDLTDGLKRFLQGPRKRKRRGKATNTKK